MNAVIFLLPEKAPEARDEDHAEQLAAAVRALAQSYGHRPPKSRPVLVTKGGSNGR
jgi:hypothetical protein